jgi:hypothetical protein
MGTRRLRTRRLRMRTRRFRTKNNRRKGGANTIRKAIMAAKINLLEAKCNEKYNTKDVDKQLKTIEQNLEEIMYQKEKLELKKEALIKCQKKNGINSASARSFQRVMGPGPHGKHATRVSTSEKYGFPGNIYPEAKISPVV